MTFNWDTPLLNVLLLVYLMLPTLLLLAPGLALAAWSRRRSRPIGGPGAEPGVDGAGLARSIFEAAGRTGVAIVATPGPLANFYDPWRSELRLAPEVHGGRTAEALATSAHEAGHALQDWAHPRLFRLRTTLLLGLKLAIGAAWVVIFAGLLMLNPLICQIGALIDLVAVLALLPLHRVEVDANRRVRELSAAFDPIEADPAARRAFEAAPWADLAACFPLPRPPMFRAHRT